MQTRHVTWAALAAVGSIAVAAVACGGAGTGSTAGQGRTTPSSGVATGQGQLAVNLVDAPNPAVDEIWVNVERVVAHSTSAGWVTVSTTPVLVNLLALQTESASLGFVNLPAGTVTQIRLVVSSDGNYVVTGGNKVPLDVPSGSESGIKIIGPWEVPECSRLTVTLDFDGKNSIHLADRGDLYNLRPVIRVKKAEVAEIGCTSTPDGGADAGADGGADAGTDAGTDAGADAGTPPPLGAP